ncbi:MAG: carboxymuconolactone decarboxylase family protein [Acidobacteriota bacterium]
MAKKKDLVKQAEALMKDKGLTEALAAEIEKQRGVLGFLLGTLRERPRTFNPYLLKGRSVYNPTTLDRKTAELVAVAAATALRCEHCLDAHMERAMQEGASMEEIMDVLLISGAISESSTLSVAFRKFKQKEGRVKRGKVERP